MDFISFRQNCGVFGEDLVTGLDAIEVQTLDANELRVDDGKVNLVPKQDAYSRSLTDLISELERRSLPVKGFFSDDVKVLQAAFDKEHEAYIETKKKELIDSKLGEAQAFAERQKEELIKASIGEEADEISRNRRIAAWFQLILNGSSPLHCRIDELTDVSVRSLSKALWNDTRLVSLDVSNMQLCDNSGAYLARVLQNNNSIQKLELAGNQFASKCCAQLALSLSANDQTNLGFLGLDSNPLATGDNGKECVMQLAEAIGKNR
jgi:predicted HicB family RNase H-like nuclease